MKKNIKITLVGGGSYLWVDELLTSLIDDDFFGRETELCLYDINPEALDHVFRYCYKYNEHYSEKAITLTRTLNEDEALYGANYVIIAIGHGGMAAELEDHYITRRHGFYCVKGSEGGVAGASRTIRQVPEFIRIARKMKQFCPDAMLLNISNPLTALTRCVHKYENIHSIGFCHGVTNCIKDLFPFLGVESMDDVSFSVAGVDHCSYLTDFKVRGEDAFEILKKQGVIEAAWEGQETLEINGKKEDIFKYHRLRFIIWDMLGCMPSIVDDHCTEFFYQIVGTEQNRDFFNMHYDRITERQKWVDGRKERILKWLAREEVHPYYVGNEVLHRAIEALEGGRKFQDVANYRNKGQVAELPMDAVVETVIDFDATGIHPSIAHPLPKIAEAIVRPTVLKEEMFMEAAMEWDVRKLSAALSIDPLVQDFTKVRTVAQEILDYNAQFLPKGWI